MAEKVLIFYLHEHRSWRRNLGQIDLKTMQLELQSCDPRLHSVYACMRIKREVHLELRSGWPSKLIEQHTCASTLIMKLFGHFLLQLCRCLDCFPNQVAIAVQNADVCPRPQDVLSAKLELVCLRQFILRTFNSSSHRPSTSLQDSSLTLAEKEDIKRYKIGAPTL